MNSKFIKKKTKKKQQCCVGAEVEQKPAHTTTALQDQQS